MKYKKLGSSPIEVSEVCLGTMTWGTQNSQEEAFQQIEFALDRGINFFDTAEMYAVPPTVDTYGKTELIIGNWLAANPHRRKELILATKIAGNGLPWIRKGEPISGEAVKIAVDESLKRLQTDYIDLYQLHWPNRSHPHFGKHWPDIIDYSTVDASQERAEHLEILQALDDCVKAGKILYCGLSDDTPWGINEYIRLSEEHNLPRMVSIQNEFNLLHLLADAPHVIETCILNDVAFLPWSPLATGALSGKYLNGQRPEGSRWSIMQRLGLFRDTEESRAAISAYQTVANNHNLSLAQMALAYVYQFQGVTSTIIGATNLPQLDEDIKASELILSDAIKEDILKVIKRFPMPF